MNKYVTIAPQYAGGVSVQILSWMIDFIIPFTMVLWGMYAVKQAQRGKADTPQAQAYGKLGKVLVVTSLCFVVYAFFIKMISPLPAVWLNVINNGVYLLVYVAIFVVFIIKNKK